MKLLVCAMEASSNIHLKELKKYLNNDIELVGVFDKELGNPLYDLTSLAIMGFTDAIKRLRFFFKLRDEFGQTFVIVTHNEELANMADRKLVMSDGLIP